MADAGILALVRQSLNINYMNVISVTLFVLDWLLLFSDEVTYIWNSRWTFPKILYLWTRYSPIVDIVLSLLWAFLPNQDSEWCKMNHIANSFLVGGGIYTSELILIWRTFALWRDSKMVKWALGGLWAGLIPLALYLVAATSLVYAPRPLPRLPGCNLTKSNDLIAGCFIILAVLEVFIVTLTLVKAVSTHRNPSYVGMGTTRFPLMYTLYRDGILFFICLASLSIANVLAPIVGVKLDAFLLTKFLRVMHTNLCCRVILHIREAASHKDGGTITGDAQVYTVSRQFAVRQRCERNSVALTNIGSVEFPSDSSGIVTNEGANNLV
ncbi:hypothetical protein BDW22DRAFT_1354824 [Trametopsis cervina]|nr:hypothetical protein BDW22DRAFT_1354824 [Trametopsis cervina]